MSRIPALVIFILVAGRVGKEKEKDCFVSFTHFESVCCFRDNVKDLLGYLPDLEQGIECCGNLYMDCPGRDSVLTAPGKTFVPAIDMEVVIITDHLERSRPLFMEVPFPLRVLGSADDKFHPTYKPQLLHDFVRGLVDNGRGNTLVIMVDAFDVAWMGCDSDLVGIFNRWGRPLFVSAERNIWPFNNSFLSVNRFASQVMPDGCDLRKRKLIKVKSPSSGQRSCFPNSGCWGGLASNLHEMLSDLYVVGVNGKYELTPKYRKILEPLVPLSLTQYNVLEDDQAHLYAYIYANPSAVWVDQTSEICTNLHGMQRFHFSLSGPRRMIWVHPFQRHVCFAHANGGEWSLLNNLRSSRLHDQEPVLSKISQPYLLAKDLNSEFWAPEKTAFIDLGQCFTQAGLITDMIFNFGLLKSSISIAFVLYRPLPGESARCGNYQLMAGSQQFKVARNRPDADREDFFFNVKSFDMFFQPGDCLGWHVFSESALRRELKGTDYEGFCVAHVDTDVLGTTFEIGTTFPFTPQDDNMGRWSVWALTA